MNGKVKQFVWMVLLAGVLLVIYGCKKSKPATPPAPLPAQSGEISDSTIEQTTCPVMGNAINKAIFTEYNGKKVYFCCPGCKPEFEKNPEKYIAKLPQFKN